MRQALHTVGVGTSQVIVCIAHRNESNHFACKCVKCITHPEIRVAAGLSKSCIQIYIAVRTRSSVVFV